VGRALVALVTATKPARLVVRSIPGEAADEAPEGERPPRKPRAWFTAKLPDGARWTLAARMLDPETALDYANVQGRALGEVVARFHVDVAELRALVGAFGRWYRVALFPDGGMVAWGQDDSAGMSLERYPEGKPAVVFQQVVMDKVLDLLPKQGAVSVEVTKHPAEQEGGEETAAGVLIGGELAMPLGMDDLPDPVREQVKFAFGLGPRGLSKPRREDPPAPYEAEAFGIPALHLGLPTAKDLELAQRFGGARFSGVEIPAEADAAPASGPRIVAEAEGAPARRRRRAAA
jgi:hypothetical protein